MLRLALTVTFALMIWLYPTAAVSQGCLPTPLPAQPPAGEPSYSMNVETGADKLALRLWRHPCQDSAQFILLLRAVPTGRPVLQTPDFFLVQTGQQIDAILFASTTSLWTHKEILAPVTVILGWHIGPEVPESFSFNKAHAFSLLFSGRVGGTPTVFRLDVPAGAPIAPPTLSVTVVSRACNPCHSGQTVAFDMLINNPGDPRLAEIKGGLRFPDGQIFGLVSQETMLSSGASVIPLIPAQALPAGLPTIDLTVEAAILEPELGVTLSRHNATLHLLP